MDDVGPLCLSFLTHYPRIGPIMLTCKDWRSRLEQTHIVPICRSYLCNRIHDLAVDLQVVTFEDDDDDDDNELIVVLVTPKISILEITRSCFLHVKGTDSLVLLRFDNPYATLADIALTIAVAKCLKISAIALFQSAVQRLVLIRHDFLIDSEADCWTKGRASISFIT